jgi:Ca-activated chloride channel family protein
MEVEAGTFGFAQPFYLWLLIVPGVLLLVWIGLVVKRRADVRRLRRSRVLPVAERHGAAGDLAFWVCVLTAASLCIVALARPHARVTVVRRASADLVVLQDGSASMYVNDIRPDRWRRSVQFLRALADALSWEGDRVALALFAQVASPQLRLTRDPNAFFFFLDHLADRSPFRLEDNPTWDTNIEEAVSWGLKLVEKDEELFGSSPNPKAFVVVSDGQAWSGRVAAAVRTATARGIPIHVVGVGTTSGGLIPDPSGGDRIRAVLDRDSLREIARAGGGQYFELGSDDRAIAFQIVGSARRRAAGVREERSLEDLYWPFLLAAGLVLGAGTCLLRDRTELAGQAAALLAGVLLLASAMR